MRHVLVAALAAAVLLPAAVHARDPQKCRLGDVKAAHGEVRIVRDGASISPVPGEPVCARDRIVTGARGVAELTFPDGTAITVGRDSEFVVNRWKARRFRANDASFELVKGAFRAITGAMTQRAHRFEIRTTIATVGVRGTDFWGGTTLTPDALEVVMLEGKGVYVTNDAGTTELTTAGTGTTVEMHRTPGEPKAWSPEKVARAVETITP